ncbi:MAG: hypothetical protein PHR77_09655, partial [Kiritimatiellae bacterium]|nr:hypothetical protein [Kiritimatiellia bacterium]
IWFAVSEFRSLPEAIAESEARWNNLTDHQKRVYEHITDGAHPEMSAKHIVRAKQGTPWTCPVCGEINLQHYNVCRNCGDDVARVIDETKTSEQVSSLTAPSPERMRSP